MFRRYRLQAVVVGLLSTAPVFAANAIEGQVIGAGGPIAGSTVTLWAASADPPKQLAQARTGADGRFALDADGGGAILYLVAKGGSPAAKAGGDNPAIALLTVIGSEPPANVVIDEMTTVASVSTHNQFIDGTAIKGPTLGLRIAAATCPTSSTSAPEDTAPPSWARLTAPGRRPWRTSPRLPPWSRAA